jgi:alkylation response protein AidB-like acyl-CoA dehydrogenase
MNQVIEAATDLAERELFPAATSTDALDVLPVANLDALASAGFYGLFAPTDVGGLGADPPTVAAVVEVLASGCLTTALVWMQHFGLLGSLLTAPTDLREAWLRDACAGRRRGGIAFGGLLPGPPALVASPHGEAWRLDGYAPWVSGWGRIDTLHVAARTRDERIVNVAVDARVGPGLAATRRPLVAVNASATVRIDFDGFMVGPDRVLGIAPYDPAGSLGARLRLNGSLALGVARRCCALIGPSALDDRLDACRRALDAAGDGDMAAARAAASAFAMQAASALVVHTGSGAVRSDEHAQRLCREAMFTLVFGSRPMIKDALWAMVTDGAAAAGHV